MALIELAYKSIFLLGLLLDVVFELFWQLRENAVHVQDLNILFLNEVAYPFAEEEVELQGCVLNVECWLKFQLSDDLLENLICPVLRLFQVKVRNLDHEVGYQLHREIPWVLKEFLDEFQL